MAPITDMCDVQISGRILLVPDSGADYNCSIPSRKVTEMMCLLGVSGFSGHFLVVRVCIFYIWVKLPEIKPPDTDY